MISGVIKTHLKQFKDERGKVMHMLRCDEPHFKRFGEIYFSWINPGIVKGWKLHKKMTMNFCVPLGNIKLVLYDGRVESSTYRKINEFHLGVDNYCLLTIPDNIWYGFASLNSEPAMVANCATIPHDPAEVDNKNIDELSILYTWSN